MFLYYAFLDVHKYTTGFGNTIRQFFLENYEDIFNTIEYSHFLGLIVEVNCLSHYLISSSMKCFLQYLAIVNTFVWQYTNVFIILLSSSLALRYRQITNTLKNSQVSIMYILQKISTLMCKNGNENRRILMKHIGGTCGRPTTGSRCYAITLTSACLK